MVKFRIVKLDRKVYKYRVDQRHWFLFIPYWDTGAGSLCPKYFFESKKEVVGDSKSRNKGGGGGRNEKIS